MANKWTGFVDLNGECDGGRGNVITDLLIRFCVPLDRFLNSDNARNIVDFVAFLGLFSWLQQPANVLKWTFHCGGKSVDSVFSLFALI